MREKWKIRLWIVVACFALATLIGGTASAQTNLLFTPLPSESLADITPAQSEQLRALQGKATTGALQLVRADVSALQGDFTIITLPDDGAVRADKRNTVVRSATDFTWIGDFKATGGQALLVIQNGEVTGYLQNGTNIYSVTPLGGGIHALVKVDTKSFPPDHPNSPTQAPPKRGDVAPQPSILKADTAISQADTTADAIQVDVLVAYTSAARIAYGGSMSAFAQLAVDAANLAYSNSNAGTTLRLVGTQEITYSESGKTFNTVLNDLLAGSDPQMAAVHTNRDQVGADMVALMINLTDSCGLASSISASASNAYATVYWNCSVSNHSFAHELGHLFGARHDPYVDPTTTPFAYGHGYITPDLTWRTVMAYVNGCGSCPRLQYFSNPSVLYQGKPMGTTAVHDNARVHRERVATVAAFRSSSTPPPTCTLNASPSTISPGQSSTLTWTSTNATTVNFPGLGSFAPNGSTSVSPTTTTSYTGTFTGSGGSTSCSATVTVTSTLPAPVATAATNVTEFTFTANWNAVSGATGYRLDVSLSSTFSTYALQDYDAGNVLSVNLVGANPNTTYYYRLRAYNGTTTSGNSNVISVTTLSGSSQPTCSLSANPSTINLGQSSTLSWTSTNATGGSISPSIGAVGPSGSTSVTPTLTTTYTGIFSGAGGSVSCSATVTVTSGGGAPPNNNFAAATSILLGQTLTGTNVSATQEAGEPNPAGVSGTPSVWWNFQPASSGRVKITTAGSNYDTTLGVYTGSSVNALTLVADNDDENYPSITTSTVTFSATAGTIYRIQVNGYNGAIGAIQLAVRSANLAHDFSGDGKSDILLRHSSGYISMFLMNGATVSSNLGVGGLDPSWAIVGSDSNLTVSGNIPGTGDFNGDGKSDILLRHSSGYLSMYLMNGATVSGNLGVGGLDPSWAIVGTGDFNGDGKSDMLLRHTSGYIAMFLMNGATVSSNLGVGGLDPSWSIVGIGDFNGDGKSDILLRHSSGYMSVFLMNGATVSSNLGVGGLDPSWTIVGTGDFNGDGKSDILLRHSSGYLSMYLMNGATVSSNLGVGGLDTSWQIVSTGDYNSDGKSDILLRHTSGFISMWLMNSATISSNLGVGGLATSWTIVE